jgi:hypothetical protein
MKKLIAPLFVISALGVVAAAFAQAPAPGAGGAPQVATPEVVMANNDTNKDGIITKEEATKVGRNLAQAWDQYDANKDGKVDMEEIKKGLAAQQGGAPGGAPPAAAAPAAPPAAK